MRIWQMCLTILLNNFVKQTKKISKFAKKKGEYPGVEPAPSGLGVRCLNQLTAEIFENFDIFIDIVDIL